MEKKSPPILRCSQSRWKSVRKWWVNWILEVSWYSLRWWLYPELSAIIFITLPVLQELRVMEERYKAPNFWYFYNFWMRQRKSCFFQSFNRVESKACTFHQLTFSSWLHSLTQTMLQGCLILLLSSIVLFMITALKNLLTACLPLPPWPCAATP